MKEYKCDICKKRITKETKCITEGQGLIKFRIPGAAIRNAYAGFEIILKSNSLSDMCKTCAVKVIIENS